MPKHILNLVLLLVLFAVLGYAAKQFFTVDTFYLWGHYRGASVAEIASDKPKYATPKSCEQCHSARYAEWSKGVHNKPDVGKVVKCEVCHGPSSSRDVKGPFENSATGKDHPKGLKLAVPTDTVALCTLCHEKMPGRPAEQKQIVVEAHAGTEQCKTCHNPHSPKLFAAAGGSAPPKGDAAAGKAIAADCAGCHGPAGISADPAIPSLAGQKAVYLFAALKAYRTGARSDPLMSGLVQDLKDSDAENIAAYYAGLTCKSAGSGDTKAASAGQALAAKCAACHGAAGISGQASWPNLAGLSKDYFVSSMQAYKTGARKNGMMANVAKELSDADAANLAAFYANSACK